MLKLKVLSLLLTLLTVATASQPGPFHSAVDDAGQVYYAASTATTVPIELGPYQTYFSSQAVEKIPEAASTLIFVASNIARYTNFNPAAILFSSDPPTTSPPPPFIVSDASWYCKGFGPTNGVTQANWPKIANAKKHITDALTNDEYKKWPKAVELFFYPVIQHQHSVIENIPLQAKYIWAADAEPGHPENPPRNAICIKSLA